MEWIIALVLLGLVVVLLLTIAGLLILLDFRAEEMIDRQEQTLSRQEAMLNLAKLAVDERMQHDATAKHENHAGKMRGQL
jgi:hypothetical protein